jgi:hypothetical protein
VDGDWTVVDGDWKVIVIWNLVKKMKNEEEVKSVDVFCVFTIYEGIR